MNKNALLELLANNRLEDLFGQLKTYNNRDLILLESQWNDLRHRQQIGTVGDEQADLEDARIRQSLLAIIESMIGQPAQTPGAYPQAFAPADRPLKNRPVVIGTGLVAMLAIAVFLIWGPFHLIDASSNSGSSSATKTLVIPKAPISIVSKQAGLITWQLLQVERSEFSPASWQLTIEAKCIKPLYGLGPHTGIMHLRHERDELAPFAVEFPFVEAGATGTGSFHFEVPKTWKKASLVIYQQEYDHPKETSVELDLGK